LPRIGLDDVREILGNFVLVLAKAEADIPKGHRRTERERLVRTLAAILQDAGEVLDAKPKGTLCQVVEIVLQDVGEEPSDVRKIVRPVVLALEKTTA
jgi:hypothetical protein